MVHCANLRESNKDSSFQNSLARLKESKTVEKEVLWHRGCYSSFTNQGHILHLQKRTSYVFEGTTNQSAATGRSSEAPMDWSKCMFCQEFHDLNQVQTMETSAKIIRKATCYPVRSRRLAGVT